MILFKNDYGIPYKTFDILLKRLRSLEHGNTLRKK